MPKLKETSTVCLVTEALRTADDFMSRRMIEFGTGRASNAISGALHHLHKTHVVDVVVDENGTGWWFALPAYMDQRKHRQDEHAPNPTGIKRRRIKKVPT
jgi:hypothetical protein